MGGQEAEFVVTEQRLKTIFDEAFNIVLTKLKCDQSTPTIIESKVSNERKSDYHHAVYEALDTFDKKPKQEQNVIIEKARLILDHSIKNHPELINNKNDFSETRKELIDAMAKMENKDSKVIQLLIKTYFNEELILPNKDIEYVFGDMIVPIKKSKGSHNYPLDLPIQKQDEDCDEFIKFGGDDDGNFMTNEAKYVRLPDLWEVVAFIVAFKGKKNNSLLP